MTIIEANNIFKIWSQWFWPTHFVLDSIFIGKIPESYLPYTKEILEEALNIVAKQYYDNGDYSNSEAIKKSICILLGYSKDKDALQNATKVFSNPQMIDILQLKIDNYKKDWDNWVKKQDN